MEAHTSKHDLSIQGMTCASCVRHVEKALTAVPGVESASVNLVTKHAHVVGSEAIGAEALVEAVAKAGYGAQPVHARHAHVHEDEGDATVGRDTVVAALLTSPLLIAGMAHGALPWFETTPGRWLQLVLATAVVGWSGRRFFRRAWAALRRRSADMDTLVALGVGAAWLYSALVVVAPGVFPHAEHGMVSHVYFEAAAVIVTFVLIGKYLEARSRTRLTEAVRKLAALQPKTARRRRGATDEDVQVEALAVDDLVVTRPGERVAADAEVMEGTSAVDESMLTGESIPVDKTAGATIYAGTLNRGAPLVARVTRVAGESALARIAAAVREAQGARAPIARLADVVSGYFVPAVLVIALLTFGIWLGVDPSATGFAAALERFVAVLIVACPCALGLATPAAVAVATGRGAELGILIKGGEVLETASRVNTVLIDKTGTLTRGRPELTDLVTASGVSEADLLGLAASAERDSEHPIAHALVEAAAARGMVLEPATEVRIAVGFGVGATVNGKQVHVGTAAWVEGRGVATQPLAIEAERLASQGRTVIFVAVADRLAGVLAVADRVRASSREAVDTLRADGMDVAVVTGDREATAHAIATDLGIGRVFAGVLPVDKARVVAEERARGRRVAMVGDGINDAPALAAAEVGVAVAGGTDIATAAADIVLTGEGVAQLPRALELARAALRTIRQNLFWAFAYNVMAIPIAAGALYVWTGWQLSPVLASAAMSLSSVSVITNSLRLRRFGRARGRA